MRPPLLVPAALAVLLPALALGQTPPRPHPPPVVHPGPPAGPVYHPPPAAADRRALEDRRVAASRHHHDGFYARFGMGAGAFMATSQQPGGELKRSFSGLDLTWELLAGATFGSGVTFGGGVVSDRVFGLSGEAEDGRAIDTDTVRFSLVAYGPFFDVYPDPHGGFHAQLFLGLADLNVHRERTTPSVVVDDEDPHGFAFILGAGYEWWVGDEVGVGVLGRFTYAPLDVGDGSTTSVDVVVTTPALLLTATYN